jgi:hypothetical protein
LQGGQTFTTVGNFTNKGLFTVGSGSTFTVGGTGTTFTQTAGMITDDGSVNLPSSGTLSLQTGSLIGKGTVIGALTSSATVDPGDSATTTGILTDNGTYTQNSAGSLNVGIGGTTAGTKYDVLAATTARLGGTLNISLLNGYVPAVGNTFKVVTYGSETGTFSTITGLSINSSEHFTVTYQGTDVLLTVVSGPAHHNQVGGPRGLGSALASSGTNQGGGLRGIMTARPGTIASNPHTPAISFQAAAASVMPSSSAPRQQATFGLVQSRPAGIPAFSGVSIGNPTTSRLRFPGPLTMSKAQAAKATNGAYGLRNRAVGGGFALPLGHMSKPQMGFLVE